MTYAKDTRPMSGSFWRTASTDSIFVKALFICQRDLCREEYVSIYLLGTKRSSRCLKSVNVNWGSEAEVDRKNNTKRFFILLSKRISSSTSQQIHSISLLSLFQSWSKFFSKSCRSKLTNWPLLRLVSGGSGRSIEEPAVKSSQKHSNPNE